MLSNKAANEFIVRAGFLGLNPPVGCNRSSWGHFRDPVNPVDIQADVRALELMLYGGSPLRPAADFGREEMGHFDPARVRAPEVYRTPTGERAAQVVIEQYVLSADDKMHVCWPAKSQVAE